MGTFSFFADYARFLLNAQTEYNLHSPFVYDFYVKVVRSQYPYPEFEQIRILEKEFAHSEIFKKGFEANSFASIQKPLKYKKLLFRIARYFKPENILELSSSIDLCPQYLTMGNRKGKLTIINNRRQATQWEELYLKKEHLRNIYGGSSCASSLQAVLEENQKTDLLFFNGIHQKEDLISYFHQCLPYFTENSVFVLDNIHHSKEMNLAWTFIKNHPQITVSIDLFHLGITFFKPELSKQDFKLRF